MEHVTIGILAHVDAGKTTLSESLLYSANAIRKVGRVDHKDTFLDYDEQERNRGITIFLKQANFNYKQLSFTLLDTPGHVDFSLEMEKTLQVLDYAIVLISALDKVQSHTETIFKLLKHYQVPTYIFVNKMDITYFSKEEIMKDLQHKLHSNCIDFTNTSSIHEQIAMCDEEALEFFSKHQVLNNSVVANAISKRTVFPCIFGSALKNLGIDYLLSMINMYHQPKVYCDEFSAKVFKISRDETNTRLVHLKITGGKLKVKATIGQDKVDQIRIYSGIKYQSVEEVVAGQLCCIKGLHHVLSGETLGNDTQVYNPLLTSFMSYLMHIEDDIDPLVMYKNLKILEDEEPQLQVSLKDEKIHMQLMGEIQIEIMKKMIYDRFQVKVSFSEGNVVYKETILEPIEGVGHYEPLAHYAEVHVLLTPLARDTGLLFENLCDDEMLNKNYQTMIMNHLQSKEHLGVLTKSPLTDVKITLLGGKFHLKHSDSSDFKEASHRAVSQGLMKAKSALLEPYYQYRIQTPLDYVSSILYDLENMQATYQIDYQEEATIIGKALVSKMNHYYTKLLATTKGSGKLSLSMDSYGKSIDEDTIIKQIGYNPNADLSNPSGSIFFKQGAGFYVSYDEVETYMHVPYLYKDKSIQVQQKHHNKTTISQSELNKVLSRSVPAPKTIPKQRVQKQVEQAYQGSSYKSKPICLLVDGYNMIFAWESLSELANDQLDAAREELIRMLSSYQGYKKCKLILVFDAYKLDKHKASVIDNRSIHIVYTKQAQTADQYIELSSKTMKQDYQVQVATSDYLEQMIVLGQGAFRISAKQFEKEVKDTLSLRSKEFKETQKEVRHQQLTGIKGYKQ